MLIKPIPSFMRFFVRVVAGLFFIGLYLFELPFPPQTKGKKQAFSNKIRIGLPRSYGLNTVTLRILSLIKNQQYPSAVKLLEKEFGKTRDRGVRGHYSLLLSQIPLNVPMKRPRHEYVYTAARYAENISSAKRMQLWIEAGDGFFKTGRLKEADKSYKKAFHLSEKEKAPEETVYILYKRAWIQINEKNPPLAFRFLTQALEKGGGRLTENILSDMGRIWVESRYFKNKIPLKNLEKHISSLPAEQEGFVIGGVIKGLERMKKKGVGQAVFPLSKNKPFSTRVLGEVLSRGTSPIAPPCGLLTWMRMTQVKELNREKALSVLNSCAHTLISAKKKIRRNRAKIRTLISLYENIERKGIERWPLIRCYEFTGQKGRACNESLISLTEAIKDLTAKTGGGKITTPLTEALRLCGGMKSPPPFLGSTAAALLSSNELIRGYGTVDGEWENALFHLLDGDLFYPAIKKSLLTADIKWKGKDLLPRLFLSHIADHPPDERKRFFNRFGSKPLAPYDLDILIAGDFLTAKELQVRLPFSDIDSYQKTLPWFKKAVSGELSSEEQKEKLLEKLLEHFPTQKKDRENTAVFLTLNWLKSGRTVDIFKHWNKVALVFNKKNFAEELFEKTLQGGEAVCEELHRTGGEGAGADDHTLRRSSGRGNPSDGNPEVSYKIGRYRSGGGFPPLSAERLARFNRNPEDRNSRRRKNPGERKRNISNQTTGIKSSPAQKAVASSPLLKFMGQCCRLPTAEGAGPVPGLKVPSVLQSNNTARDCVLLARIQNETLRLEKTISRLEKNTSKMIRNLKKTVSNYRKRKWRLPAVAEKVETLLKKQIELFSEELAGLADSSPHGEEYRELGKIIEQWR